MAEAATKGLEPPTLLALLKHPLFRLGGHLGAHTAAITTLERAVFRGPRPRAGSEGLASALKQAHHLKKSRNDEPLVVLSHSMGGQLIWDAITWLLPAAADTRDLRIDFWCATVWSS